MEKTPQNVAVGEAGARLFGALVELAESRSDLREALRTLLAACEGGQGGAGLNASGNPPGSADGGLVSRVLVPRRSEEVHLPRPERQVDLSVIVRRARWKAAACRLVVERRRIREEGGDEEELARLEDKLRQRRVELEDCWAWMLEPSRTLPGDALLEDVAACYDTVALAAEATLTLEESGCLEPKPPSDLLYLLAESQSALLSALHKCDLRGDADQRDLFLWLKQQTTRHRIYVDRHMRLDDPADSTGSEELSRSIQAVLDQRLAQHRRSKLRSRLLGKVRYHRNKLSEAGELGEAGRADLSAIEAICSEWEQSGLPLEDASLAALLGELASAEEEVPPLVHRILELNRSEAPENPRRDALAECRSLVSGRRALLLGRAENEPEGDELVEALDLQALEFASLEGEAEPLERIRERLDSLGVELVLIAQRLPAEEYTEFKRMCMERGVPFVRLATGLDPREVAHQVLRQVAWRLRRDPARVASS